MSSQKILPVILLSVVVSITGCNSRKNQTSVTYIVPTYTKCTSCTAGNIEKHVICANDSSLNYAIYLPASYSKEKKYPLILFFDPHADGALPLNMYKTLADSFGFIIAGSNNSQNGMQPEDLLHVGNTCIEDILHRFPIDDRRLYLAGFSGGARVAGMVADNAGGIRGVIACGAGINVSQERSIPYYNILFIAGLADFNYGEMKNILQRVQSQKNHIIEFDGKHEWAPKATFNDAFMWMLFNEMKDNITPRDSVLIESFTAQNIKKAEHANAYDAAKIYGMLISFTKGIHDTKSLSEKYETIRTSASFRNIMSKALAAESYESEIQQVYKRALSTEGSAWWKDHIAKLQRDTIRNKNTELWHMYACKRLLAFVSMACYANTSAALNAQNTQEAGKSLLVYGMTDPKNPDYHYLSARYYAQTRQSDKAVASLKSALDFGMKDTMKILNENDLQFLMGDPRLKEIQSGK